MKIAILGAGRMGTWFIKELSSDHELCFYDIDNTKAAKISHIPQLRDYSELKTFEPELLINSVSIKNTFAAFESASSFIPENCIISDIMSVKGGISDYYEQCGFPFASIHPMFGPTFTNTSPLHNENVIVIEESCHKGARFFKNFFKKLELNIFECPFREHDKIMAHSLTLPFASVMLFADSVDDFGVPGSTFKKILNIAKGLLSENENLLSEILLNSYSLPQLEKMAANLEGLKKIIEDKDSGKIKKSLEKMRKKIM